MPRCTAAMSRPSSHTIRPISHALRPSVTQGALLGLAGAETLPGDDSFIPTPGIVEK
jgi:hypothetical protein